MSIQRIIFNIVICLGVSLAQPAIAKNILIYGDSLSAAYGLELQQGWAHLLSERLAGDHSVLNASVSGETSAGGLARLPTTLETFKPDLVLLELGANDGLRGQSVAQMQANLTAMTELIVAEGGEVVIFGITLPPSYGPRYIDLFEAVFPAVAEETGQAYFDFVVERFIGDSEFIQNDGLHPTAAAQPEIEALIYQYLDENELLD